MAGLEQFIKKAIPKDSLLSSKDNALAKFMEDWGKIVVKELQENLDKKGKNAKQTLRNSIHWAAKSEGFNVKFQLLLNDYYEVVDKGRPPTINKGGGRLLPAIKQWIRDKPIVPKADKKGKVPSIDSLAFMITRKIHRFGFKGSNFYTDVFKDGSKEDKLTKGITKILGNNMQVNMVQLFKQEGFK